MTVDMYHIRRGGGYVSNGIGIVYQHCTGGGLPYVLLIAMLCLVHYRYPY